MGAPLSVLTVPLLLGPHDAGGKPVLLTDRPDPGTLDVLRNAVRDHHVLIVPDTSPDPVPLLFLHANPLGTAALDTHGESERIRLALRTPFPRVPAGTLQQVGDALRLYRPRIMHFSGHGGDGRLWFEGRGFAHLETGERLADEIFAALGTEDLPEWIILNACESAEFIEPLSQVCSGLIVMRRVIADEAALAFSEAFYGTFQRSFMEALEKAQEAMLRADPTASGVLQWVEGKAGHIRNVRVTGAAAANRGPKEERNPGVTIPVWFGTERLLRDPSDPTRGFSDEQGSRLLTGKVEVSLARGPYGEIGGRGWFGADRAKTIASSLKVLSPPDWHGDLHSGLAEWKEAHQDEAQLLLFVHGFNVGFDEAARRAAQIHHDLNVPGITSFYSWASSNHLAGYWDDENRIEKTVPHLQTFLEDLLDQSGVKRFHLLAHSMGHRALLKVLHAVSDSARQRTGKPFGQIFLCAPDVAAGEFRAVAGSLPALAGRTTLYISRKDRALVTSSWVHGDDRAGLYPEVTVAPGIDTVATEGVSGELLGLGHGYYAGSDAVLGDLSRLILEDQPPAMRARIQEMTTQQGERYYSFIA